MTSEGLVNAPNTASKPKQEGQDTIVWVDTAKPWTDKELRKQRKPDKAGDLQTPKKQKTKQSHVF